MGNKKTLFYYRPKGQGCQADWSCILHLLWPCLADRFVGAFGLSELQFYGSFTFPFTYFRTNNYQAATMRFQLPSGSDSWYNSLCLITFDEGGGNYYSRFGINVDPDTFVPQATAHFKGYTKCELWTETSGNSVCGFGPDDGASLANFISSYTGAGSTYDMGFKFASTVKMVLSSAGELAINLSAATAGKILDCNGDADFRGDVTLYDAKNLIFNTSTGTKLGTATNQKLSFWNATPIIQPAGANQAALTNNTGGSYDGTLAAISGSGDDANINNNFTDLHTLLNEIRTALVNVGLIKGSA